MSWERFLNGVGPKPSQPKLPNEELIKLHEQSRQYIQRQTELVENGMVLWKKHGVVEKLDEIRQRINPHPNTSYPGVIVTGRSGNSLKLARLEHVPIGTIVTRKVRKEEVGYYEYSGHIEARLMLVEKREDAQGDSILLYVSGGNYDTDPHFRDIYLPKGGNHIWCWPIDIFDPNFDTLYTQALMDAWNNRVVETFISTRHIEIHEGPSS